MKKWLFNPFIYIAGAKSFLAGWGIMLVTAVIAIYATAHFNGVMDMHAGLVTPVYVYFLDQLIAWGCAVLLFYIAALVFARSSRFIDIAGTLALARWPMIFVAILCLFLNKTATIKGIDDITANMIVIALVSIVFTIWMIALMYNAFKVSSNLKDGTLVCVFIAALLLSEILSLFVSNSLYKHFI